MADCTGGLRKTAVKLGTLGAGLDALLGGLHGRGRPKGTQRWLWATVVATVGEAPSLTQESVEQCARDEQESCIVPSLAPPSQAPQQ